MLSELEIGFCKNYLFDYVTRIKFYDGMEKIVDF